MAELRHAIEKFSNFVVMNDAMIPFLRSVANELVATRGADLHDLCLVLPGRRAALFMRRHIQEIVESQYGRRSGAREMPLMMTLAEFCEKMAGQSAATRLELIFTLYAAWKKINRSESDFSRFRSWAQTVINDFDQIDAYDVDAHALLRNISQYDEISTDYLDDEQRDIVREYFGEERPPMPGRLWRHYAGKSEAKRSFRELWELLAPLYDEFNVLLNKEGRSYPGAILRRACRSLEREGASLLPRAGVVFIGLDDLSAGQKRLLRAMKQLRGDIYVDFFWDAPGVPLHQCSPLDASQRHWELMKEFPCSLPGMGNYSDKLSFPALIDVVSCPGNTSQAKVAGILLTNIIKDGGAPFADPARVAVVLPDESLLFPMYAAVPGSFADDVNLTMGYPMRMTSAASFVALLRKLQLTVSSTSAESLFHQKELRTLLAHPFMQQLLGVATVEKMQGTILCKHLFYVSVEALVADLSEQDKSRVTPILLTVLQPLTKADDAHRVCAWLYDSLNLVFRSLACSGVKRRPELELEHLLTYLDAVSEFEILAGKFGLLSMDWHAALSLIDRMLQNHTVHLQGEPLTGLQIMGMLETRALDFDYLIIPSMNERIFPVRMRVHSFIPDSLRRFWHLPTVADKEQALAYHFYRLIARSKQVHLLFDASQSGRKSGDPSRYLLQLRHIFGSQCNLKWRSARFKINTSVLPALRVEKNPEDLQPFLTPGSGRNISASSLKDYLACTLRFYIAHVLRKKLSKEPEEFMDAATQGTILHDSMQQIYDSLLPAGYKEEGKTLIRRITPSIINDWIEGKSICVEDVVKANVRKNYPAAASMHELSGDSLLISDVITHFVYLCLKADLKIAPFEYIDNEHRLNVTYPLQGVGNVNMTFIIDRLDRLTLKDGVKRLRIVDYKTGSDVTSFKNAVDLFHPTSTAGNTKGIFQLYLYSLLYPLADHSFCGEDPIALSIYSTRLLEVNGLNTIIEHSGIPVFSHLPVIDDFKEQLDAELKELFDLSVPFEQTQDKSKCAFCDFRQLCGR